MSHKGRIRKTFVELRQSPRVRVPAPFACSFSRLRLTRWFTREPEGLGVVFDLTMKGAKVLGETELKPGDRIALNLRLPTQRFPMNVEVARVRWVGEHLFGLEFMRLSSTQEWRLWKFIEPFSAPAKADR
jgi:hypothetical protein